MKISQIDKNFMLNSKISRKDIKLYDVCLKPFKIYGLIPPKNDNDRFRRMPEEVAKSINTDSPYNIHFIHSQTAGGRVRFKTDADYIAIRAIMPADRVGRMPHFSFTGSSGFDLYTEQDGKQYYIHTFTPPFSMTDEFISEFPNIPKPSMREYTLNMPLYSDVSRLYIILNDGAKVIPCRDYKSEKPIVYYGSSITEGGCASRPGNTYEGMISRALDCNYINLGFTGNAKAEVNMAKYIASLDMSCFVYDYDHNAPDVEYLKNTHKRMFDIIRASHPNIPIICISRPVGIWIDDINDSEKRRQVILDTVNQAKKAGDNNVYFIDGREFSYLANEPDSITIDGTHPNDLGFSFMAEVIGKKIKEVLGL